MTKNLSKSLIAQRKKSEPFRKTLYGSLGIPLNGSKLVQVPNRQSYVYVRLNDNQNEVIQAFNNTVSPSYDLPVVVMREGGRYTVKQVNTQRYENNWNNSSPYLPSHGTAHSFFPGGGADISWIYSRQIMHGLVYPTVTGTTLDIASFPLYTPNGWVLAGATGTVNLLQYRPVSGSASLMALLYADASNGNPGLLVNSGSYIDYSITGSVYPYIPRPNLATQIPLAAIRLSTGTLNVGWDNLYDVRQWIHAIPSGSSSGGGGGGVDTIGFAGLYNGVPLGTGTMLNVRGNASFSRSGTMFDLYAHPPGIDQIGVYGLNQGSPIGTGSWFNVNGSRLILTISGTVLNLSNSPDPFDNIGMFFRNTGTAVGTGTVIDWQAPLFVTNTGTVMYPQVRTLKYTNPFTTHGNAGTIGAGGTNYLAVGLSGLQATASAAFSSKPGTLKNLFLRTGSGQPASGSLVVTVQINGVDTSITFTIPAGGGAGTYSDLVNTAAVVAGDRIGVKILNNATGASAAIGSCVVELEINVTW